MTDSRPADLPAPASRGAGRSEALLRVMSYNVKDLTADPAAAARVVRAIRPDVLCLQEVPRRLTTEFRLPAFARDCDLYWGGGRIGTGGTAVLTALRVRVHAGSRGRLRVRFPDRTRGFAGLEVSLPGGPSVTVLSVHLGLRPGERRRHAELILRGLGNRTIVAGDLNEGSEGAAYGRFLGRLVLASADRPTFPSDHPHSVLDVIFASPDLTTWAASDSELSALDLDDLAAGSDHRPVWVDVTVAEQGSRAGAPARPASGPA